MPVMFERRQDMADSQNFPRDSDTLALAIAQLTSDPLRRALAEEADRAADHGRNIRHRGDAQTSVRGKPANNES
jgi:hypothetical protein